MAGNDSQYPEAEGERHSAGDVRGFQFSLTSLFVIVVVTALVLTFFLGIGSVVGMSRMDVVSQGLGRLLFQLPILLVWLVGLTLAMRYRKRNRLRANLTMIALGGLILTRLLSLAAQMVLMHLVVSNRISHEAVSWGFSGIGVLHAILDSGCWILILAAIFAQRTHDVSKGEGIDASGEALPTNEHASL